MAPPGKQGVSAEGRQAIALLKGREKTDRERLGRRGDRARRPGDRTGLPHPCLELFPRREAVSASNGPTRRGEPDRLRLWRTGWSVALKAGEPAYSLGPHSVRPRRRLAGGCAPSDPRNGNGAS